MNKKILMDKKIILALLIVSIALIGISSVSAHDVNANDVGDIISIENNTIDENNGYIQGVFKPIHNNNTSAYDDGAIYSRPANILTYDYIQYQNILFVDDDSYHLIIEDGPQNIDLSKCRNVTIFSKLSGQTSVVSVPEGYMIVIDENNLTLKHM